jgi:hypothetical protein
MANNLPSKPGWKLKSWFRVTAAVIGACMTMCSGEVKRVWVEEEKMESFHKKTLQKIV